MGVGQQVPQPGGGPVPNYMQGGGGMMMQQQQQQQTQQQQQMRMMRPGMQQPQMGGLRQVRLRTRFQTCVLPYLFLSHFYRCSNSSRNRHSFVA